MSESSHKSGLSHLRRRTVLGVLKAWREIRGTARGLVGAELQPSLPKEDMDRLKQQMQQCLDAHGGEITERAHTAELGHTYLHLTDAGRIRFLKLLATDFDTDPEKISNAIADRIIRANKGKIRFYFQRKFFQSFKIR